MLWRDDEHPERICPKTGCRIERKRERCWASWALPFVGLASLLWFLIRVIPKPSRAAYPCQRAAFPLASGFVVWLTGIIVSSLAYRKAKRLAGRARYAAAGLFAVAAVAVIWGAISITADVEAVADFVPIDPPNSPIGVGKGIHPGRVVWVRDPSATTWDGVTGFWWEDRNLDPQAVDNMVSRTLRTLAGVDDDAAAWDAIFRYFNRTHGAGDVGYQPGEKIAIKIYLNAEAYGPAYDTRGGDGIDMSATQGGRQVVYSQATILYCDILGNCGNGIRGGRPTVDSTILRDNGRVSGIVQIVANAATVSYSNVQGGWPGEGNIDADPDFVKSGYWADPADPNEPAAAGETEAVWVGGDYRLKAGSHCIDAGNPVVITSMDVERAVGSALDIGAYEFGTLPSSVSTSRPPRLRGTCVTAVNAGRKARWSLVDG